jgi:hypothetical protein
MIREKGLFSNRYLPRKGKENQPHNHTEEADFPLAYTSNKYASKERMPSLSVRRKKEEKKDEKSITLENKPEAVMKLEKELREARGIN